MIAMTLLLASCNVSDIVGQVSGSGAGTTEAAKQAETTTEKAVETTKAKDEDMKLYPDTNVADFGCVFDTYKEPYYSSDTGTGKGYMYLIPGVTDINSAAEYVEEYEALLSACGYTEYPSASDGTTSKMYFKTLSEYVMVSVSTDTIMIVISKPLV